MGRSATPALMTTWPPTKVDRKLSLRTRMRADALRASTLFIVTLHVFALVRRHVASPAPRTFIFAVRRPYERPLTAALCAAVVIAELHAALPKLDRRVPA